MVPGLIKAVTALNNYLVFVFLFGILGAKSSLYSASFYGDSLIFQKVLDFSSTTNISFSFQTQSKEGLLLAAAGSKDYIIIGLKDGRPEVKIFSGDQDEIALEIDYDERVNNLDWHEMYFYRDHTNVALHLNGHNIFSSKLDNISSVMGLDFVFLGGYDHTVGALLGNKSHTFYRGCLLDVRFNQADVLYPLTGFDSNKVVHNVEAGCSNILRSQRSEVVSFQSARAYSLFKLENTKETDEAIIECMVSTTANNGIILFNIDWETNEFVGAELKEGKVRAAVSFQGSVVSLQSTVLINDGRWHRLRLRLTSYELELRVAKNPTRLFFDDPNSPEVRDRQVSVKESLYVGGVDENVRHNQHALADPFRFSAFPGCVKKVKANKRAIDLNQLSASRDIESKCKKPEFEVPEFIAPGRRPSFILVSPRTGDRDGDGDTSKDDSSETSQKNAAGSCYEFNMKTINATEGEMTKLSSQLISYQATSNLEESLSFRLVESPLYGQFIRNEVDLNVGDEFSMALLSQEDGGIFYRHWGNESFSDTAVFQLFTAESLLCLDNDQLCKCSNETSSMENTVKWSITIAPVDDQPHITIPSSYVFKPYYRVPTPFPVFPVLDTDSAPDDVIYRLLVTGKDFYVEDADNPGVFVTTFSHGRVLAGGVRFVCVGDVMRTRMLFRLSNHVMDSAASTYVIRVECQSLVVEVADNSGVTVFEKDVANLTRDHISIYTNADDVDVDDIDIIVKTAPHFGKIEILDDVSKLWVESDSFRVADLSQMNVRYRNAEFVDEGDSFEFVASKYGVETARQRFNVTVVQVSVTMVTSAIVVREPDSREGLKGTIDVSTAPPRGYADNMIQVMIVRPPRIFRVFHSSSELQLGANDTITLAEVKRGEIQVEIVRERLRQSGNERFEDDVILTAVVAGRYRSRPQALRLTYIQNSTAIKVTSSPLQVTEGGDVGVTSRELFATNRIHDTYRFEVIAQPQHGRLVSRRKDAPPSAGSDVTNIFTTRDIEAGHIYYENDGSEHSYDVIELRVTPVLAGQLPTKVERLRGVSSMAQLEVEVSLVNDNRPVRVVDRPFTCVINSQRLITPHDLWFRDDDVTNDDLDLTIFRHGILNGEIVNASSRSREKLYEFTQRDIANNQVMFRHSGKKFGRFVFWVKDGLNRVAAAAAADDDVASHLISGLFVVSASEPFLTLTNQTQVDVLRGSNVTINSTNRKYETNVNGDPDHILYTVTESPLYGKLVFRSSGCSLESREAINFTQGTIDEKELVYCHLDKHTTTKLDHFNYTVRVGDSLLQTNTIEILIRDLILPPDVRNNRPIFVDQTSSALIRKSNLRVTHDQAKPRDVIFRVTSAPRVGRLQVEDEERPNIGVAEDGLIEFSQFDINQGFVRYLQDGNVSDDDVTPRDVFTVNVDVRDVGAHIDNLSISVNIIPILIPLRVSNFSVEEGKSRVLIQSLLNVTSHQRADDDDDLNDDDDVIIVIVESPRHGRIESSGKTLTRFPLRLSLKEFVYYSHDGSDTLEDSYQLRALNFDGSRKSRIVTQHVEIEAVNDATPVLVNNTGMLVWTNSITTLKPNQLSAKDADSPPNQLEFRFLPPSNGFFARQQNTSKSIEYFTQADINDGNVVFVHKGSSTGGFTVQVNDGINYAKKSIFVINSHPLVITVDTKETLEVFPGCERFLSRSNLNSDTNDQNERRIVYVVEQQANFGKLVRYKPDNSTFVGLVTNFTNEDVLKGRVSYMQNIEVGMWNTSDQICVTAVSFPAKNISENCIRVSITYDAYPQTGRRSSILTNKVGVVKEGSVFLFDRFHLDSSNFLKKLKENRRKDAVITYHISKLPNHGKLMLDNLHGFDELHVNDSVSQSQIDSALLEYHHDDSESTQDEFSFEVYVSHSSWRKRLMVADMFSFRITLVNDHKPEIQTKAPSFEVIDGYSTLISNETLLTTDRDVDDVVFYQVFQASKLGNIYSGSVKVVNFTQDDINANKISFHQHMLTDGNNTEDTIYVSGTDQHHPAVYTLLSVRIKSIKVELDIKELRIKQGVFVIQINRQAVNWSTNGEEKYLLFTLKEEFTAGNFIIDNNKVSNFTSNDVSEGRLYYVINDRACEDGDAASVALNYHDTTLPYDVIDTKKLLITVEPSVTVADNITFVAGEMLTLSTRIIDSSELSGFGPPSYEVVRGSEHAVLTWFNSSVYSNSSLTSFSYENLLDQKVILQAVNTTKTTEVTDHLTLRIYSEEKQFQSAMIKFHFNILPAPPPTTEPPSTTKTFYTTAFVKLTENTSNTTTTTATTRNSISTTTPISSLSGEKVPTKSGGVSGLLIWLIASVCVIVTVLIIALLCCWCIRRRKKKKKKFDDVVSCKDDFEPSGWHQANINQTTMVKVTPRVVEPHSEQCPTAPVIITALQGNDLSDDDVLESNLSRDDYLFQALPNEYDVMLGSSAGGDDSISDVFDEHELYDDELLNNRGKQEVHHYWI